MTIKEIAKHTGGRVTRHVRHGRVGVERDFSVLVFEAAEPWLAGRAVSAVRIPTGEMGRRAVRMLRKKIETPNERCAAEPVAYEAVFGGTVAPASSTRATAARRSSASPMRSRWRG
jgi:DNA-binding LacI/PurR family transcriptional regulator